jgi:hypothetical protein
MPPVDWTSVDIFTVLSLDYMISMVQTHFFVRYLSYERFTEMYFVSRTGSLGDDVENIFIFVCEGKALKKTASGSEVYAHTNLNIFRQIAYV